jgi:hypothetical protein
MININHLETSQTSQAIFDNFNSFILSEDRRVFNKLVARTLIYNQVKDIDTNDLIRWLNQARTIQWDYKNLVKRKGILERLEL